MSFLAEDESHDVARAAELATIARHWARAAERGKGVRFEARAVDLLNLIGVGELILAKAAEAQRVEAERRDRERRSTAG